MDFVECLSSLSKDKLISDLIIAVVIVGEMQISSIDPQLTVAILFIAKQTPFRSGILPIVDILSSHADQHLSNSIGNAFLFVHRTRAFVGMLMGEEVHIDTILIEERFEMNL